MNKKQFIELLKEKNINISLYDFIMKKSKYGNEIWCYKKEGSSVTKKVSTGNVFVDGVLYKYKSEDYFERCKQPFDAIKREYKYSEKRIGFVLTEKDLKEMDDEYLKYYFL